MMSNEILENGGGNISWGRPKGGVRAEGVKVNFIVTASQKAYLEKISSITGVPLSHHLRNLIDADMGSK